MAEGKLNILRVILQLLVLCSFVNHTLTGDLLDSDIVYRMEQNLHHRLIPKFHLKYQINRNVFQIVTKDYTDLLFGK